MAIDDAHVEQLTRSILGRKASRAVSREIARRLRSHHKRRLPAHGETAAVSVRSPKTAALCFDRVWAFGDIVPEEVGFFGETSDEVRSATLGMLVTLLAEAGEDELADRAVERLNALLTRSGAPDQRWTDRLSRFVADAIAREHQQQVVSTFASTAARDRVYLPGEHAMVVTLLENVAVVNEDAIAWTQVLEFRRDDAAKHSVRKLRHWLDASMVGKTEAFIHDEVAIRLENYEAALRRHGIETLLGALSATFDGRFLLGAAAATATTASVATPTLGLIAGAGLVVGRVALYAAERFIDFEKAATGESSEVSFVSEVKHRLPGGAA